MYRFTQPENQKLFWCPYSPTTVELFYDTRCAISGPRLEPIVWSISKVEDMNVKGIIRLTFKQDKWDSNTDLIEYNDNGDYVCAWCNYYKDGVPIKGEEYTDIPSPIIHSIITYSGVKPEVKVNGSFKKFTVTFYDDEENENEIPLINGKWEFKIDNDDASSLVEVEDKTIDPTLSDNQIKVKFIGSDEWINKNLDVWYVTDTINGSKVIKSHVTVNVIGL